MERALLLAKQAYDEGEVPVGAVVVKKTTGEIVGEGRNMREGAKNALAHAEIIAIDMACRTLGGWRLPECAIYVTLEPCPMCCGAIINSRIDDVIFGAYDYKDRRIDGLYHTVRPVALAEFPVYIENTREYSVINTDNFGRCVQMEVGAMLVGRIVNECPASGSVSRGEEKGHFEYGGSTIIVLIPEGKARLREDIAGSVNTGVEIPVVMGEAVGRSGEDIRK